MAPPKKNLLITGLPGVGKTTLIRRLCDASGCYAPVGFYTEEIREAGVRKGFELVTLDGRRRTLSHTSIKGPFRVGKYGVDVAGFEELLDTAGFLNPSTGLIIIDEIGKMECLSGSFRRLLRKALDSEYALIATIALKGGGIIQETKQRPDAVLFEITKRNRDSLLSEILARLQKLGRS